MIRSLVFLLGSLAVVAPASAFNTVGDCQRWMEKLRERTGEVAISSEERRTLLDHVDAARGDGKQVKVRDSIESVKRFQDRAAQLAADGKVSRTDGAQLGNLSETVRRCLEAVESNGSAAGANEPFLGD